jgi:hypothetical protein
MLSGGIVAIGGGAKGGRYQAQPTPFDGVPLPSGCGVQISNGASPRQWQRGLNGVERTPETPLALDADRQRLERSKQGELPC